MRCIRLQWAYLRISLCADIRFISIPQRKRANHREGTLAEYVISCSSTADLSAEHFAKRNINWIPFHFFLDEKHYYDDLGKSISNADFYQAMVDGADTRTSQINVEEYRAIFEGYANEGKDVLHVCLSSGISGTYNAACIAAEELRDKYPDRKIYVVDSLSASSGYGLLMDGVADKRDEGMTIDELHDWVEANKIKLHHWFFSTDLTFFIKGGRVSKASGIIGGALKICPMLNVNSEGRLIPREKIRTRKRAMKAAVAKMLEYADDRENYSGKAYIYHSAVEEEAKELARMVEEAFPKLAEPVTVCKIGTTIGSHTGPGTIGLSFWGDPRTE